MLTLVDALASHRVCPCDCFRQLTLPERTAGIRALYMLDDALRGWGYTPNYVVHGDRLWRETQKKDDPSYRGVAVRFGECIYRRLVGSMIHECIHAVCGEAGQPNYGVPFGLPYGVPHGVAEKDEEAYLERFNFGEARAWVGVWIVGRKLFDIDWSLRTARDIGTYCFVGGNALVPVPPAYRAVAHIDPEHHRERYHVKGRKLEEQARAWFAEGENLTMVVRRIEEAAAEGQKKRARKHADPVVVAKNAPKKIERNEPCVCGSATKFKDCCGERGTLQYFVPANSR